MPDFTVKVSRLAESDLISIWHSIADQDPHAATRILKDLDARMALLDQYPDRGASRPEFGSGIRILIEGNYLIFYRRMRDKVEVLRVVHGAMDLTKLNIT